MAMTLVGVAEAADMLGVQRSNFLRDFVARTDFPEPVERLRCGPIWRAADVQAFIDARVATKRQQ